MLELHKAINLLKRFSLITVGENKQPNYSWKKSQTSCMSEQQFTKQYNYKGGYIYQDQDGLDIEIKSTEMLGICTGYADLEGIDLDLKIFPNYKDAELFFNEYISLLKDEIEDFEKKVVIVKTKNKGYHLLYQNANVTRNTKIAKPEFSKEALIESRGKGGYLVIYDSFYNNLRYEDIQYITDEERQIIWDISKMYNSIEDTPLPKEHNVKKSNDFTKTVWDDFNEKNNAFDIVQDEFDIVRSTSKKLTIKRTGAKSASSGYYFKNENKIFLHSTGTIYPAEKQITPYVAYCYKYHNGNFSECAKALYREGYGQRIKQEIIESEIEKPNEVDVNIEFPLQIFPEKIQSFILQSYEKLGMNVDYMGCSLIWAISTCLGNAVHVKVKNGWIEPPMVWMAIVGDAGIGKTPSIYHMIRPLMVKNQRQIKKYYEQLKKYQEWDALPKKEKDPADEVAKPLNSQFIANDITVEALVSMLSDSERWVGVFKDELAGWIKDMNKYRQGSDLEFWLSVFSGKPVNINRVTRIGSFVERPFVPVIGGIQPSILDTFYTAENKDNGFVDRLLLCYPNAQVELYNDNEIDNKVLEWYFDFLIDFKDSMDNAIQKTPDGDVEPLIAIFSIDCKKEWIRIFNSITERQNSDEENEYLKSMFPKQKSYIPRFAVILNALHAYFDNSKYITEITSDSMLNAELLSNYFIKMASKVKDDSVSKNVAKELIKGATTNYDKIKILWTKDKLFNKNNAAKLLGISRQQVHRITKELEKV